MPDVKLIHYLLLAILDAVYVDAKEDKCIVAVKPKPPFRPVFQVASTREGSGVHIINEPPEITPEARLCFWWRRGRVELPLKHRLTVWIPGDPWVMRHAPVFAAAARQGVPGFLAST